MRLASVAEGEDGWVSEAGGRRRTLAPEKAVLPGGIAGLGWGGGGGGRMAETMRSARASSSWDLSAGPVGRVIVARGEPLPSAQATRAQQLSSVEATRRSWHWRWGPGGTGQKSRQLGVGVGSIHRARSGVGGRELSAVMPTAAVTSIALRMPAAGAEATAGGGRSLPVLPSNAPSASLLPPTPWQQQC